MTSENYRQLLNYEFEAKEMTKEEFDNTLMHFAMLYHKEQCVIHGVVQAKPEKFCKGSMQLGTGCGKCSRCLAYLRTLSRF